MELEASFHYACESAHGSEIGAMLNSRRQSGGLPLPNIPFGENQYLWSYDNMYDQNAILSGYDGE